MKTPVQSHSSDPSPHSAAASIRHRVFQSRKTRHWCATATLMALLTPAMPLHAQDPTTRSVPPTQGAAKNIPIEQLGTEAQKQYAGDGNAITPTADGARLRAAFQDLAAEATPEGLWLESTADEDAGKPARFRVRAVAIGREGGAPGHLTDRGRVRATHGAVLYLRAGLVEEYSVSMDGVRQDFVLAQRPAGKGELSVELAVEGARAEAASGGVKLTLDGCGREIAYSRLYVADANGRELTAKLEVAGIGRIQFRVDDSNAIYPIRIDPTFSDDDWSTLGSGMNGAVHALAVSGGDLYAGGSFTTAGGVTVNNIAKWNGSVWSALGTGMNNTVRALAVSGSDLYAGGDFTTAGGVTAWRIAKWNGSVWSKLSSSIVFPGTDAPVYAVAVSGSDLYIGGRFTHMEGAPIDIPYIAKWDGSGWSELGTGWNPGMNNWVRALAVSGTDLYAGGDFTTAGGISANYIAKWNGSTWSALGSGMGSYVHALAVSGTDLYAAGDFTTAGGISANHISKWNGSDWCALGTGMNSAVYALTVSSTDLYAGGAFTTAGGVGANRIARWNGDYWSSLGSGTDSEVCALAAVSDTALYAGGKFTTAGGMQSTYIAQATKPPGTEIDVEQPLAALLGDGSSGISLGLAPVGYRSPAKIFTVRNPGTISLLLSSLTMLGGNAGDFIVDTTGMATTVVPGTKTTFTVTFIPAGPGNRSTTLQITSNDADESPFDITLTGNGLSFTDDFDGDGLGDGAEFHWAALGFDWQVSQPGLVNSFLVDANRAGLYTTSQVQALHIDTPLIQRDGAGLFTLILGLQKSATLLPGSFQPFPFIADHTLINAGKIEFRFTSPDNAAFFRLEGR